MDAQQLSENYGKTSERLLGTTSVGEEIDSALHSAVKHGDMQKMRRLLRSGQQVDARSYRRYTALHYASNTGQVEAAAILLEEWGADANASDEVGYRPLHLAVISGHQQVVRLLLQSAQVDAKTNHGWTALHLAVHKGRVEVAAILLKGGADVEAETATGSRALHLAAYKGNMEMILLLLTTGDARAMARTSGNTTAAELADHKGHFALADLLRQHERTQQRRGA